MKRIILPFVLVFVFGVLVFTNYPIQLGSLYPDMQPAYDGQGFEEWTEETLNTDFDQPLTLFVKSLQRRVASYEDHSFLISLRDTKNDLLILLHGSVPTGDLPLVTLYVDLSTLVLDVLFGVPTFLGYVIHSTFSVFGAFLDVFVQVSW